MLKCSGHLAINFPEKLITFSLTYAYRYMYMKPYFLIFENPSDRSIFHLLYSIKKCDKNAEKKLTCFVTLAISTIIGKLSLFDYISHITFVQPFLAFLSYFYYVVLHYTGGTQSYCIYSLVAIRHYITLSIGGVLNIQVFTNE